jgi:ABC-2 type transport system ATP-binding protein
MGQKVSLYQGPSPRENIEFYARLHGLGGASLEQRWGELQRALRSSQTPRSSAPENLRGLAPARSGPCGEHPARRVCSSSTSTAGVDVLSRGLFWELIRDEAASGVTVFVTTHFLEEVDLLRLVSFIEAGASSRTRRRKTCARASRWLSPHRDPCARG